MSLLLIAALYNTDKTTHIGYRLLDTSSNATADVGIANLISVLKSKKATIENVELQRGKLVGTNGSLDRYAKCTINNELIDSSKNPLVIINRIGDQGFTVSDYKGTIKKASEADLIVYASKLGLANGKVVTVDGNTFISSIIGNYDKIDIPRKAPEPAVKKEEVAKTNDSSKQDVRVDTPEDSSVLTQVQKNIINQYYGYYFNRAEKLEGSSDRAKTQAKAEIAKLKEILQANKVEESLEKYSKYLYIIYKVPFDKLSKIIPEELLKHIEAFLQNNLPIVRSMAEIINSYYTKDSAILKQLFSGYSSEIDMMYSNYLPVGEHKKRLDATAALEAGADTIESLQDDILCFYVLRVFSDKLNEALDKSGITAEEAARTLAYGKLDIPYISSAILRYALMYLLYKEGNNFIIPSKTGHTLNQAILSTQNINRISIINDFINMCVSDRERLQNIGNPEGVSTLTGMFSQVYKENHIGDNGEETEGEDVEKPPITETKPPVQASAGISTGTSTSTEELTKKPKSYTVLEWVKYLLDRNTVDESDVAIIITKDILSRGIKADRLSSKQLYRINQAIEICEKANNERLGITPPSQTTQTTTQDTSSTENISYDLASNPDIETKVNSLISKANTVEMSEVIKNDPKILNICYSIIRYRKATTRQLKHVDEAIKLLNSQ